MPLRVIKRALVFFLALLGISAAAIGALVWHHVHIANPCPPSGMLNDEAVTCYYRVQPTGDWLPAVGMLAIGFALCLLVSWLSFKLRRPAG